MSHKIFVLLDKVRSAYNVGSIFRSCDSAGINKLILCGYTATPPHPKLYKTALGSIDSVSWEHHCDTAKAIQHIKQQNFHIIALEPNPDAVSIFETDLDTDTCLIFGHEETGISKEAMQLADKVVKIPHFGIKDSLNVAVAAGITVYEYQRKRIYPY